MKTIILIILLLLPPASFAKTVTLLIHSSVGGMSYRYAQELQPVISTALNATVVIESKPGGDGYIAARSLVEQQGSNITILLGTPRTWPELVPGVDLSTDLIPVAYLGYTPGVIVSRPDRYGTLDSALANPNVTYGISAASPSGPLMKQLIGRYTRTGVEAKYKSGSAALTDVLGGHVDLAVTTPDAVAPYVASGHLVALAILGTSRSALLPSANTLGELGYSTNVDSKYYNNFFLWCNKQVDRRTITALTRSIQAYMLGTASTSMKARLDISYTPKNPTKHLKEILND
jgi:tripartite-type tricarboxylate transporter receptor subunit TctC